MSLIFPEGQRYDCGSCTKCCRTIWNVHVSPRSYEQVHGSPLFLKIREQYGEDPMFMTEVGGEKTALCLVKKDHGCVFLGADKLCAIHRDMGEGAKPLGCREFPFIPVPTPDGVFVGVSFYCSAVQANSGRELPAHAEDLEKMLAEYRYDSVGFNTIPLTDRLGISWQAYKVLEDFCKRTLAQDDLSRSLWNALVRILTASSRLQRRLPLNAEAVEVPDQVFSEALDAVSDLVVPRDEIFEATENMFLVGVAGVLESSTPESCKSNTEALFGRGVVKSESLQREVNLAHFGDFRGRFDATWSIAEFRRYLEALLFRKFLASKRTVVANISALYLALLLLGWYRDYAAYAAGKLEPDIADVRVAFDVIERGFTMHSRGMDPFFHELARTYMHQIEQVLV